jgi:hypothetical protein
MTVDEYRTLVEAGVIDKVEFIDGAVVMGRFPLAFSHEQVEAAAELGIDLPQTTAGHAHRPARERRRSYPR